MPLFRVTLPLLGPLALVVMACGLAPSPVAPLRAVAGVAAIPTSLTRTVTQRLETGVVSPGSLTVNHLALTPTGHGDAVHFRATATLRTGGKTSVWLLTGTYDPARALFTLARAPMV